MFLCTISSQMVRIEHPLSRIKGLINTSSYLRCSWCLGHKPSGRKEHPRRLRNCTPPQRPAPGWSGRLGSRCFRFSATKSQPHGLVSRVSVVVSFLMASQGFTTPPFQPRVLFLAAFLKLGGTEVSFGKGYTGNSFGGGMCLFLKGLFLVE